jgi:twitching motility protein PilI
MSSASDLDALIEHPFELLQQLEHKSRSAVAGKGIGTLPEEWVGIGFRIGQEHFVANRDDIREVLMLPESMTRVPGAKKWMLGIANLRGHLLPLTDLKMFLGSGRTAMRRMTRVISVNHRDIPAGLVVDEVLGFRRFMENERVENWPPTVVRCERFLSGAYMRGSESWPIFNFRELVESGGFLQADAE